MALIKCTECGHEIARSARTCPSCGAKNRARTGFVTKIVVMLAIVWLVGIIAQKFTEYEDTQAKERVRQSVARAAAESNRKEVERNRIEQARLASLSPEERKAEEERLASEAAARAKAAAEAREKQRQARLRREGLAWQYSSSTDELSGKPIKSATVSSLNSVQFGFPYQGEQRATLHLRQHPRWGKDVLLSVERGQFLCRSDCRVTVKFDDRAADSYSVTEPDDHSTTYLFIDNYPRFVTNMRKATRLRIEATFFQEGARVLEFDVSNFEWDLSDAEKDHLAAIEANRILDAAKLAARNRCAVTNKDAIDNLNCEMQIGDCVRGSTSTNARVQCLGSVPTGRGP